MICPQEEVDEFELSLRKKRFIEVRELILSHLDKTLEFLVDKNNTKNFSYYERMEFRDYTSKYIEWIDSIITKDREKIDYYKCIRCQKIPLKFHGTLCVNCEELFK